ncbi:MAG: DNA double-strand break repair nuclease NurA [Candidatus Hodarchaeales archaeon]
MKQKFHLYLKEIQKVQKRAVKQTAKNPPIKLETFDYLNEPPQMIAIDGSNRWIWNNPDVNARIAIIRVAHVMYEYNSNESSYLKLISQDCTDFAEMIAPDNPEIHNYDQHTKKLHEEIHRVLGRKPTARSILGLLRSLREFEIADDLAWKNKDSMIVMDGALTYVQIREFEQVVNSLRDACKTNNNILIGVSKRNTTRKLGLPITDEAVLRGMTQNNNNMIYAEVPFLPKTKQVFPPLGKTFLAKLHTTPVKTFRVDIYNQTNVSYEEIFSNLAYYSKVDTIPGYPFPLVDAHNIAVLLRRIPDMYNHELVEEGLKMGIDEESLFQYLLLSEKMERDPFHRYLDDITR